MAGREVELAVVVSPREWAERLHRFTMDYGGARVRVRVLSPEDALAQEYQVLVIDDISSFLNRRLVQQVQLQGRKVLGVYDLDDGDDGRRRLEELGVDDTMDARMSAEDFIRRIDALGVGVTEATVLPEAPVGVEMEVDDAVAPRRLTAVGSSSGGCGATEVSLALAHVLAGASPTILMDLDNVRPTIAQRLGLPLHPNLRTTVDALLHAPERLEQTLHRPRTGPTVVGGLSNAADWLELRDGDVVELMRELSRRTSSLIANISSTIEDLAYYGGPGRYGLAREIIRHADELVVVALPTPVGITRVLDWVATASTIAPVTPIHVVINQSNRSSYEQGELVRELSRSYSPASVTFLPTDRRVHDAAWSGEWVESGPFWKGVRAMADRVRPRIEARAS